MSVSNKDVLEVSARVARTLGELRAHQHTRFLTRLQSSSTRYWIELMDASYLALDQYWRTCHRAGDDPASQHHILNAAVSQELLNSLSNLWQTLLDEGISLQDEAVSSDWPIQLLSSTTTPSLAQALHAAIMCLDISTCIVNLLRRISVRTIREPTSHSSSNQMMNSCGSGVPEVSKEFVSSKKKAGGGAEGVENNGIKGSRRLNKDSKMPAASQGFVPTRMGGMGMPEDGPSGLLHTRQAALTIRMGLLKEEVIFLFLTAHCTWYQILQDIALLPALENHTSSSAQRNLQHMTLTLDQQHKVHNHGSRNQLYRTPDENFTLVLTAGFGTEEADDIRQQVAKRAEQHVVSAMCKQQGIMRLAPNCSSHNTDVSGSAGLSSAVQGGSIMGTRDDDYAAAAACFIVIRDQVCRVMTAKAHCNMALALCTSVEVLQPSLLDEDPQVGVEKLLILTAISKLKRNAFCIRMLFSIVQECPILYSNEVDSPPSSNSSSRTDFLESSSLLPYQRLPLLRCLLGRVESDMVVADADLLPPSQTTLSDSFIWQFVLAQWPSMGMAFLGPPAAIQVLKHTLRLLSWFLYPPTLGRKVVIAEPLPGNLECLLHAICSCTYELSASLERLLLTAADITAEGHDDDEATAVTAAAGRGPAVTNAATGMIKAHQPYWSRAAFQQLLVPLELLTRSTRSANNKTTTCGSGGGEAGCDYYDDMLHLLTSPDSSPASFANPYCVALSMMSALNTLWRCTESLKPVVQACAHSYSCALEEDSLAAAAGGVLGMKRYYEGLDETQRMIFEGLVSEVSKLADPGSMVSHILQSTNIRMMSLSHAATAWGTCMTAILATSTAGGNFAAPLDNAHCCTTVADDEARSGSSYNSQDQKNPGAAVASTSLLPQHRHLLDAADEQLDTRTDELDHLRFGVDSNVLLNILQSADMILQSGLVLRLLRLVHQGNENGTDFESTTANNEAIYGPKAAPSWKTGLKSLYSSTAQDLVSAMKYTNMVLGRSLQDDGNSLLGDICIPVGQTLFLAAVFIITELDTLSARPYPRPLPEAAAAATDLAQAARHAAQCDDSRSSSSLSSSVLMEQVAMPLLPCMRRMAMQTAHALQRQTMKAQADSVHVEGRGSADRNYKQPTTSHRNSFGAAGLLSDKIVDHSITTSPSATYNAVDSVRDLACGLMKLISKQRASSSSSSDLLDVKVTTTPLGAAPGNNDILSAAGINILEAAVSDHKQSSQLPGSDNYWQSTGEPCQLLVAEQKQLRHHHDLKPDGYLQIINSPYCSTSSSTFIMDAATLLLLEPVCKIGTLAVQGRQAWEEAESSLRRLDECKARQVTTEGQDIVVLKAVESALNIAMREHLKWTETSSTAGIEALMVVAALGRAAAAAPAYNTAGIGSTECCNSSSTRAPVEHYSHTHEDTTASSISEKTNKQPGAKEMRGGPETLGTSYYMPSLILGGDDADHHATTVLLHGLWHAKVPDLLKSTFGLLERLAEHSLQMQRSLQEMENELEVMQKEGGPAQAKLRSHKNALYLLSGEADCWRQVIACDSRHASQLLTALLSCEITLLEVGGSAALDAIEDVNRHMKNLCSFSSHTLYGNSQHSTPRSLALSSLAAITSSCHLVEACQWLRELMETLIKRPTSLFWEAPLNTICLPPLSPHFKSDAFSCAPGQLHAELRSWLYHGEMQHQMASRLLFLLSKAAERMQLVIHTYLSGTVGRRLQLEPQVHKHSVERAGSECKGTAGPQQHINQKSREGGMNMDSDGGAVRKMEEAVMCLEEATCLLLDFRIMYNNGICQAARDEAVRNRFPEDCCPESVDTKQPNEALLQGRKRGDGQQRAPYLSADHPEAADSSDVIASMSAGEVQQPTCTAAVVQLSVSGTMTLLTQAANVICAEYGGVDKYAQMLGRAIGKLLLAATHLEAAASCMAGMVLKEVRDLTTAIASSSSSVLDEQGDSNNGLVSDILHPQKPAWRRINPFDAASSILEELMVQMDLKGPLESGQAAHKVTISGASTMPACDIIDHPQQKFSESPQHDGAPVANGLWRSSVMPPVLMRSLQRNKQQNKDDGNPHNSTTAGTAVSCRMAINTDNNNADHRPSLSGSSLERTVATNAADGDAGRGVDVSMLLGRIRQLLEGYQYCEVLRLQAMRADWGYCCIQTLGGLYGAHQAVPSCLNPACIRAELADEQPQLLAETATTSISTGWRSSFDNKESSEISSNGCSHNADHHGLKRQAAALQEGVSEAASSTLHVLADDIILGATAGTATTTAATGGSEAGRMKQPSPPTVISASGKLTGPGIK
ncbi:hypothetical protein CEUSTIGMA_g3259.t1 [Chlamydomonas eustigma]|uniref:Uncharacterized protein n=1 Tax=Chlamydomonas eustigma TaxID=1157962 RepID=A0A250WYF7_9CHLO|nr:hypothetical protein CEUSTIGMA_g3259.t1 [Chlamydomonas eustigma]|eukprot:GAX75816.1 hypothetical protein CEUSTIGMA_g3259.t1 [Chlamydomonas eustigma]